MITWGINALNHGSGLAVFKDEQFVKGYTSKDDIIPYSIIEQEDAPDRIYWYENPWLKKTRQIYAGQYATAFDMSILPSRKLKEWNLGGIPLTYTAHHASHAAAGYYTSPFNHCAVVVLDAIGEWECASIWNCMHGEMKKIWSRRYPHSLGLFYSAFTQFLGLTPIQDEGLLIKMAEQGDPARYRTELDSYFDSSTLKLKYNFHRGVLNWSPAPTTLQQQCDIAAAVQERFEQSVDDVMRTAKRLINTDCLVYMGGCAYNKQANKRQVEHKFKYIWSLPDPGDGSSSLGAVLYHTKQRVDHQWLPVKHIDIRI